MEVRDEWVPGELFASFVERMPQACIEVVCELDEGVLLARRANEPAAGEWFWPGSRLYKGEELTAAAHRVAEEELGITVEIEELFGVYSHFWETSAEAGRPSRHTVNVVFRVRPREADPTITLDDQHTDYRVLTALDDLEEGPHEYVRQYVEDGDLLG